MKKLLLLLLCSFAYVNSTVAQYVVTTLAGSTATGSADGTGSAASFNAPTGACIDLSGNVYVADMPNQLIRKITPAGVVTTFAGSGTIGLANGTGTAASFYNPKGVCIDLSGNVYVADSYNNVIRKITPAGVVSTYAGSTSGYLDGPALSAQFNGVAYVCADLFGNIYVTEDSNNRIRKITPGGNVSTIAGSGTQGFVNGTGTAASFDNPEGICADASGNLYVADINNNCIRMITSASVVTTFAGTGTSGAADGTVTAATFNSPTGVSMDFNGNIWVADYSNSRIRLIDNSGMVSTISGTLGFGFADGSAPNAQFDHPLSVSCYTDGSVYVADRFNNRIRVISPCNAPSAPTDATPSANNTVCIGNSATLTATGSGTISWYNAASGGTAIATGTTFISSNTLTAGTYTFYAEDATTCTVSASRTAITFTIDPAPAAPADVTTAGNTSVCANSTTTLSAASTASISWYNAGSGGTAVSTGTDYITSGTLTPGTYTIYAEASTACTVSAARTAFTFTVNNCCTAPNAPTDVTANANNTVCAGNTTTLSATTTGTGTINWFTGSTGGLAVATGTDYITSNTLTAGTYTFYAEASTCTISASRTAITFTVNSAPAVPADATAAGNTTVCAGSSTTLSATGSGSISWFATASGGAAIATGTNYITSNTLTAGTYTFYAEAATCTVSASRAPVVITVSACCTAPNAPANTTAAGGDQVCAGHSTTLTASSTGTVSWFDVATGGTVITTGTAYVTSATLTSGTYTYYAEASSCTVSASRTAINLTVTICDGINVIQNETLITKVYPNPTSNYLTIELSNVASASIELVDLTGRVLLKNTNSGATATLDLSAFSNGIYYMKVKSQEHVSVIKVVKQ